MTQPSRDDLAFLAVIAVCVVAMTSPLWISRLAMVLS